MAYENSYAFVEYMKSDDIHNAAKKPDFVTCEQQRSRAEYASAQSDLNLYFSLFLDLPYAKVQDC